MNVNKLFSGIKNSDFTSEWFHCLSGDKSILKTRKRVWLHSFNFTCTFNFLCLASIALWGFKGYLTVKQWKHLIIYRFIKTYSSNTKLFSSHWNVQTVPLDGMDWISLVFIIQIECQSIIRILKEAWLLFDWLIIDSLVNYQLVIGFTILCL